MKYLDLPNWKNGLFVAALTGILTGLAALEAFGNVPLRTLIIFTVSVTAKDMLLFLRQNPLGNSPQRRPAVNPHFLRLMLLAVLPGLIVCGCARFSTVQSDTNFSPTGAPLRRTTTKASSYALLDSKSALTKFRASQSDKTQTASVGALDSQASSTNAVQALEHLRAILESVK